ncbi:MAG: carbohydrate ABC transporter permease [Bacteroidetes bacterium]|nr:carbohydrate ABC transporter permease [Bacteroidota bacterium]
MQAVTISLSPSEIVSRYGLHIFPSKITLEGYRMVFKYNLIWQSYLNTIVRTVTGTSLTVLLLVLSAYPLSKKKLPNRTFWTAFIVFTMYFSGGIIPRYILVRNLRFMDSIFALILPSALSAFTIIIVRNFFMALPEELEESAKIDGANDIYILFKIVIPLSMPVIATVTLWSAVWHWNSWFDCMIYIRTKAKFVLQYVLRMILLEGQMEIMEDLMFDATEYIHTETMKMATLVVALLPIICVYPFLQKYFIKGILIGSLKG